MANLEHLSPKKVEHICKEMWMIRGALRGVGAALQQQTNDPCYEGDELFGLGQLFEILSQHMLRLEDILNCGYDSAAVTKNFGTKSDDDDSEDDEDQDSDQKDPTKDDSAFSMLMREFTNFLHHRREERENRDVEKSDNSSTKEEASSIENDDEKET